MHASFRAENLIPKIELDLKMFKTEADKEFGLEAFIMNRSYEAQRQLYKFNLILK
jgi:hypothetical protein